MTTRILGDGKMIISVGTENESSSLRLPQFWDLVLFLLKIANSLCTLILWNQKEMKPHDSDTAVFILICLQ